MTAVQKRTLLILTCVGLVYFALFLIPNARGSDPVTASSLNNDEFVTYPNVLRILTPGDTFYDTRANLFLYEDYHYGYPFYAVSALALLPVRLIYGMEFTGMAALNLLLLRQFVSILPMILAAGVLVFVQTRFQSWWKSLALFVLLLSVRGVVRNHMWWWHPDALAVLCAVLTIFFLTRDRLRFGRYFALAAVACGLATSIKLLGVFFFLTIPAYLIAGWLHKRLALPRLFAAGALFVVVMSAVVVFSNPFLFSADQRARMVAIQTEKSEELSKGYEHDDPLYYSKGPQWWASVLEKWYGHPAFLALLFASLAVGSVWGERRCEHRLMLTWVVPYSIYLLYFVAVKPDHYWLPVMLPLFSCALTLPEILTSPDAARFFKRWRVGNWLRVAVVGLVVVALGINFVTNLTRELSGNIPLYLSYTYQQIP